MFSKSQIKLLKSLGLKKYRQQKQLFLVEGKKGIKELLRSSLDLHVLYSTEAIFEAEEEKIFIITQAELEKISQLSTPQTAVAVFEIPPPIPPVISGLVLALDGVRDPGNLGTIVRLCDWFGIDHLVCSKDTVDAYNPKVVQATMGSIARVNLHYCELDQFLEQECAEVPVFGAFMDGSNIYKEVLAEDAVLVMGNEANGISPKVTSILNRTIGIPHYGKVYETESLNVATATAILLSEFRRRL